ncbi:MAG TPA: 3'-5' exonuclease, partial [Prevotella sp.]
KIGTRLQHVMIDEFQDTSTVQWRNFKVLLDECMSKVDTENLIVGDVKQSIYRWRSGDWRLLNEIEKEFPHVPSDRMIEKLHVNYRSETNIVRFNNAFFKSAAAWEYEQLKEENAEGGQQVMRAYEDVEQEVPAGKPASGFVHVELLPQQDYHDHALKRLKEAVQKLISEGVSLGKIAIIIRFNHNIQEVADYFMQEMPEVRLVSDEAFRLDASLAVNIIIDALHVLTHPDDRLATANLAKAYQKVTSGAVYSEALMIGNKERLEELLPKAFLMERASWAALPLRDLVEKIYTVFNLSALDGEEAYLCSFYDYLNAFIADNVADIDTFVDYWQSTIHAKAIAGDEIEGIRLITIHKSKGLEFTHVLMPFCDWPLEKLSTLWCKPDVAPFNELPLVPVDYSAAQLRETIYEKDYQDEHLQRVVDNLNLLYVGFTRAKTSLQVFAKRGKAGLRSDLIEQCMENVAAELGDCQFEGNLMNGENTLSFDYGSRVWAMKEPKLSTPSANVFNQPVHSQAIRIASFERSAAFRQSNKSREFVEEEQESSALSYIKIGSILHNVLSKITTSADVDAALAELEFEGVLYDHELTKEKLTDMLRKRLESDRVADWFSGCWEVYNECSILHVDPTSGKVVEHRPDRVMRKGDEFVVVDFKFASPKEEHRQQVRRYTTLLKDMGHEHVTGYLWYVYTNVISEVR